MHHKDRYGLFTAITMIVGTCIGSGIFFKSDNILVATGGSIPLGVLVFVLGALAIVFGGLCMSELASRTARAGGIITYAEEFSGKSLACMFGWFQTLIYFPTLVAVVSYVVGVYCCMLFGWSGGLGVQVLIGAAYFTFSFALNALSAKLGGAFQNVTTVVKLIPLALIAVFGLIFGDPAAGFSNLSGQSLHAAGWIAAVGPIAFSYDGWIVSTSIAHEIRDARRNMSRALVIGPLFVLAAYVLYFVGISSFVGPEAIMALGDEHVSLAATKLFGGWGAKTVLVFVIISVMGTVNGLVLAFIRNPHNLALRPGMMPGAKWLRKGEDERHVPYSSALLAYGLALFWMAAHYVTARYNLLPNSDVSEISIAMSYLFYLALYYQVFRLYRAGRLQGFARGVLFPLLASLGSLLTLAGGLQNQLFLYYVAFCLLVCLAAWLYYRAQRKKGVA